MDGHSDLEEVPLSGGRGIVTVLVIAGLAISSAAVGQRQVGALALVAFFAAGVVSLRSRRAGTDELVLAKGYALLRHSALDDDVHIPVESMHSLLLRAPIKRVFRLPMRLEWLRSRVPAGGGGFFVRYLVGPWWRRGNLLIVLSPAMTFPTQRAQGAGPSPAAKRFPVHGVLVRLADPVSGAETIRAWEPSRVRTELPADVPGYLYSGARFVRHGDRQQDALPPT